jgi:hypothetical protein
LQTDLGFYGGEGGESALQGREIGFDETRYVRILDLDGDFPAVLEPGLVDLGDRGGGDRFGFDVVEDFGDGTAQLAGDGGLHCRPRLGRDAVLEG